MLIILKWVINYYYYFNFINNLKLRNLHNFEFILKIDYLSLITFICLIIHIKLKIK